jgi:hypothetical protein
MKSKWVRISLAALLCVVAFCLIATTMDIFSVDDLPVNFIAAFLEAVITAVITVVLLAGQSSAEEVKERNVSVFQKKSEIFQDYINKAWEIWEDQKVTAKEFHALTTGYYRDLMIYLDDKKLFKTNGKKKKPSVIIADSITKISGHLDSTDFTSYKKLRENITLIINVLSDQLGPGGQISLEIIEGHDRKMFPVMFRKALLDAFNTELVGSNSEVLEPGQWTIWQEHKNMIHDEMIFKFKRYADCSIRFGMVKNAEGKFGEGFDVFFIIPLGGKYNSFNGFRKGGYSAVTNKRIDLGKHINLYKPSGQEGDTIAITPFSFSDADSMDGIREKSDFRQISEILAKRAAAYYSEIAIGEEGLNIPAFLTKYYPVRQS